MATAKVKPASFHAIDTEDVETLDVIQKAINGGGNSFIATFGLRKIDPDKKGEPQTGVLHRVVVNDTAHELDAFWKDWHAYYESEFFTEEPDVAWCVVIQWTAGKMKRANFKSNPMLNVSDQDEEMVKLFHDRWQDLLMGDIPERKAAAERKRTLRKPPKTTEPKLVSSKKAPPKKPKVDDAEVRLAKAAAPKAEHAKPDDDEVIVPKAAPKRKRQRKVKDEDIVLATPSKTA